MRAWLCALFVMGALQGVLAAPGTTRPLAPPGRAETLLPLTVGSWWTWQTNYSDMTQKVVRQTTFRPPGSNSSYPCVVVETTQGENADKVVQTEYFSLVDRQWLVVKRMYAGEETILTPPEAVIRTPAVPGDHWLWSGTTSSGPTHLEFRVLPAQRVRVPALKLPVICQRIEMDGADDHGSSIRVERWYAPGIGMVKEDTVMTRGQQAIKVHGVLRAYHVEPPPPASPSPTPAASPTQTPTR